MKACQLFFALFSVCQDQELIHFESPLTPAYGVNHPVHTSGGIFDLYPSPGGERESFLLFYVSDQIP